MIKIIATDMDGTLLTPEKQLPKDFHKTIEELKKRNIEFVIASGRSYTALTYLFEDYLDKIDFICDNGAFIVRRGEVKEISIIEPESVREIVRVCSEIPNAIPVLCGRNGTYFDAGHIEKMFTEEISGFYLSVKPMESLLNVKDDIFKIAVCDIRNPLKNAYPILKEKLGKNFNIQVSGVMWLDIMNKGIDKGTALEKIKCSIGASYEETMVFGDYYNDIELLKQARYSFVMDNANADMKQYGNFIAESNDKNGVINAINQHILQKY